MRAPTSWCDRRVNMRRAVLRRARPCRCVQRQPAAEWQYRARQRRRFCQPRRYRLRVLAASMIYSRHAYRMVDPLLAFVSRGGRAVSRLHASAHYSSAGRSAADTAEDDFNSQGTRAADLCGRRRYLRRECCRLLSDAVFRGFWQRGRSIERTARTASRRCAASLGELPARDEHDADGSSIATRWDRSCRRDRVCRQRLCTHRAGLSRHGRLARSTSLLRC